MAEAPPAPMRRIRSLIGFGLIGQVSFTLSQFAILIALSRQVSVAELGRYGLASAIVTPIYFMFALGFLANQATDLEHRHPFGEFSRLRRITSVAAFALVAVIAAFLDTLATQLTVLAFAASRTADNRSVLTYGLLQKYDRMDRVALSMMMRGIFGSAAFVAVLLATSSVPLALLGLTAVWALVATFHDQRLALRLIKGTSDDAAGTTQGMWAIMRASWPNGLNAFLGGGQTSVTRMIINGTMGIEALGRFTLVFYVLQAANNFIGAIIQSLLSRLAYYRLHGQRRTFFRVLLRLLAAAAAFSVVAGLVAWALGEQILVTIFGEKFAGLGTLFALCFLCMGTMSASLLLQGGLYSSRRFLATLQARSIALAFTVPATFVGIALAGLEGVMVAMTLGFGVQATLLARRLWREFPREETEPGAAAA